MKIGLFFGSFNPIHVGHMILAGYMAQFTDLKQVWLVVSPHNPLKKKSTLLDDYSRLELVNLAIGDNLSIKASNIEFGLPQPSYTINTLTHLSEKYPKHKFALIMGADNLETFHKWKNYEQILANFEIYVYPRKGTGGGELLNHPKVKMVDAPVVELSSSFIREAIRKGKDVRYMLAEPVYKYIQEMNYYRK